MSGPKVRRTMEWDPALYDAIQNYAEANQISLAAMVERMIREWLMVAEEEVPSTPPPQNRRRQK